MDQLFFYGRFSGGTTETLGDAHASLGNRARDVFVDWNWDGERLTLTNDRYGFYPVYYFRRGNEFAVSPSITRLLDLAGDVELDVNALSVFLRLAWLIGEDTLFTSIRALPPGSTVTWHHGDLKIESAGLIERKPLDIGRAEAIETYAGLFQRSVEKTLPSGNDFLVPLSGGRDSRHILFAVSKANRNPMCLTILHPPPRPDEDVRVSRQVCDTLKLDHVLLGQSRSRFESEIRKNELTGFCAYEHGWFWPLADFIGNRRVPVYDGIAGDVLSAGLFLTEERLRLFEQNRLEELAENILPAEAYLPKMLSRAAYREFSREKAVTHLVKELARHANQPNPAGSFCFWNRTRRCVALSPFRLLGDGANVITPFLDAELFDFLSALPAAMLVDHRFHTDTIAFAYPAYAHLPYEDKAAPPVLDYTLFRALSRDIYAYSTTERNHELTNPFFFLSRHLRALVDRRYSRATAEFGTQAIHLLQLERWGAKNARSAGRPKHQPSESHRQPGVGVTQGL